MTEYATLYEFLKAHVALENDVITHTRIGDKDANVYPGKYSIPTDDETRKTFYKLYGKWVFDAKKFEYLTEVQQNTGPVLIDFDFRYSPDIEDRQHTDAHVYDIVAMYMRLIHKLFDVDDIDLVKIFVLHKPDVNMQESVTKDGIHMVIGLSMTHEQQTFLRKYILEEIDYVLGELPLKNDYESVLDDGISFGYTNWQMFGSRKPKNDAYCISHMFHAVLNDGTYDIRPVDSSTLYNDTKESKKYLKSLVPMVGAHYTKYPTVETRDEYEEEQSTIQLKKRSNKAKRPRGTCRNSMNFACVEDIKTHVEHYLHNLTPENYEIPETYEYVMALPVKYANDYNTWIRVGWALHNFDHAKHMFLIWMLFSAKSDKFNIDEMDDHYDKWTNMSSQWFGGKMGYKPMDSSGNLLDTDDENELNIVTMGTIKYWLRQDCPEEYNRINNNAIEQMFNVNGSNFNEVGIASILHRLYGDRYRCVSLQKGTVWYEYRGHRWHEIQGGYSLRQKISDDVAKRYFEKSIECMDTLNSISSENEHMTETLSKMLSNYSNLHILLKRTNNITNIMKEAAFKFFDDRFYSNLDTNPYLLCCKNGVLDFKENTFRPGRPDDYLSLCTHINYIPISEFNESQKQAMTEIIEFMEQLFPHNELNKYMWDHLASTLLGTNENQTFNIYTGSGRNGKSKMVDLMGMVLGDYKGTVPITLVTNKRVNIGSASPEIIQLKGRRYAVMQEPSKGDSINEGIMKELTGGDPIQGRALYKDVVTFIPQFKLAVCTNSLFDIKSNDDGTWRRIRVCDFKSKFTENPYEDFTEEDYPHQFPVDKRIDEKFKVWSEVFLSMLVERLRITKGIVEDCEMVVSASNRYREGQDIFADFVKNCIERAENELLQLTEVYNEFKIWYTTVQSSKQAPKRKELEEYLNKRLGKATKTGWVGWQFKYEDH